MARKTVRQIVQDIVENGRASDNDELESEFEYEAGEAGYTRRQIDAAIDSDWFPWFAD